MWNEFKLTYNFQIIQVYIRDIGSSSGTFINHLRLCAPNHTSPPHQLRDHDVIQLGIDFQGGLEPVYRAVRIRFELNRPSQRQQNPYTQEAFQQLRQNLFPSLAPEETSLKRELTKTNTENCSESPCQLPLSDQVNRHNTLSRADIQECCICLYAIAPSQALFLAPCSHLFHFKCLGPILFNNYPGFSCPLCRGYSDLEASVAVEVDEVLEALNQANEQKSMPKDISIDTIPELEEEKTTSTHTCSGSTSEKERNSEALVPSCTEFSLIQ